MISVDRFIAPSSARSSWMAARVGGVTATQVARAATPKGFEDELQGVLNPTEILDNPYMAFGRDNEQWIMLALKDEYGVLPNEWLVAHETERWQLATPDGLSLDHRMTAEVKTTGTDWGSWDKVPIHYRRQVQWQLHVTGAETSVFAWLLRKENKFGQFVPAWFEPKSVLVERDEKMIEQLREVATRLRDSIAELSATTKGKE